jgi:hypothetical protein
LMRCVVFCSRLYTTCLTATLSILFCVRISTWIYHYHQTH